MKAHPWITASALALACATTAPHIVSAQEGGQHGGTAPSCVVTGHTAVKADTTVYDQRSGGTAIAKLTGAKVPLAVNQIGKSASGGRVHVSTTKPSGYLRIDGWAARDGFRFFAARDLPVAGSNVWISQGQQLSVQEGKGGKLEVSHKLLGSAGQQVKATVPCDALTLTFPTIPADEAPERSKTYQSKTNEIALYDQPRGEVVFTLRMEDEVRKVFWSTEARGGYVHVVSRTDVTIDAWVRWRDVTALRHAELFDPSYVAPKPWPIKTLRIQDPPAARTATKDLPVHHKAENSLTAIGAVEKGAQFYPMEQSGDWTNVLPSNLGVLPAGGGFWVRTASLPKPGS
ncbi:MAG: hypothetical protein JRI68_21775 [Deltaproteobacteria bacterium]|nr:hypothetical protein [Deltaproteobacteria bacterium]